MKTTTAVLSIAFLALMICVPGAFPRTHQGGQALCVAGIFSDLSTDNYTGDTGGMEVILLEGVAGDWATVVTASGDINAPVLVKVTGHGKQIEFTLPATHSGGLLGDECGQAADRSSL
jgi:hypothetical protein